MPMCSHCGDVVAVNEIENTLCPSCRAKGVLPPEKTQSEEPLSPPRYPLVEDRPFAIRARGNGNDYLMYGLFLPIFLLGLGLAVYFNLPPNYLGVGAALLGIVSLVTLAMSLCATIRRINDLGGGALRWVLVILGMSVFPPIPILYLLLAPGKYRAYDEKITKVQEAAV